MSLKYGEKKNWLGSPGSPGLKFPRNKMSILGSVLIKIVLSLNPYVSWTCIFTFSYFTLYMCVYI